ncbi:MAG: hypothetical protein K6U04_14310 [Armatimonadetes bacterium]|nr:hypothetical protein [Armatimonadota bacterium]
MSWICAGRNQVICYEYYLLEVIGIRGESLTAAVRSLVWPVCLVGAKENDQHNVMTAAWISQVSHDHLLVMVSILPRGGSLTI